MTGELQAAAEGGCQCGQVRYRIAPSARRVVVCHCRDCQRQSSSAFGMSLFVPEAAFELKQGKLAQFEVTCASGRIKTCAFCPDCGVRICHRTERGLSIKAGTLDDASALEPAAHFWVSRKQPWVVIADGIPIHAEDG